MFEFLFRRPGNKAGAAPTGQAEQRSQPDPSPAGQKPSQRAEQAGKLAALAGDELAAADFILNCEFSELRLAAAELVHSRAQLERVHGAMRNTDRRVAKLMQSRLDAIRHHQAEVVRAQTCIDQASALADDEKLSPNQVADLDRRWSVLAAPELAPSYDAIRARLGERLAAQVSLQRAMIDRLGALRLLGTSSLPAAELAAQIAQLAQAQADALASPERASLPRSLVNEFAIEHARIEGALGDIEQRQSQLAAREAVLADWEAAPRESLDAERMRRTWQQFGPMPAAAPPALQERFDALIAAMPQPVEKVRELRPPPAAAGASESFLATLAALEAALQHGSLAAAADCDKALKDSKGVRLTPPQAERLGNARAEFKRLSDWARWGGNVSREELIKAVEQLPSQNLGMTELAKKVGSMRERWKALDALSGVAPKTLWERFDAACTVAYAPAAAHFKQLAGERHANADRAQALVDEAVAEAVRMHAADSADWKHVAATVQRLRLAWSHLGAIDRKDKKRLDEAFAHALNVLQGPLEDRRKSEVAGREALIEQAIAIDAHDRHAPDKVRALQERWQEQARALPLERKSEQALWQRFRAACDAVFASRKNSAHAADAERRAHHEAKDALSARLEAAVEGIEPGAVGKLLREAAAEWQAIGPVPRAHEAQVEKRYQTAVAAIRQQVEIARRNAALLQAGALRAKLRLCQSLETDLAQGVAIATDEWVVRWTTLAPLEPEFDKALEARFRAALAAADGPHRDSYVAMLEQNRAKLLHQILRLEIAAGIDSGADFAHERLKLQVEALQTSLKSGHKPLTQPAQLLQLSAMPALADERTAARIEHLFSRIISQEHP